MPCLYWLVVTYEAPVVTVPLRFGTAPGNLTRKHILVAQGEEAVEIKGVVRVLQWMMGKMGAQGRSEERDDLLPGAGEVPGIYQGRGEVPSGAHE